jgi:hypothetical protein
VRLPWLFLTWLTAGMVPPGPGARGMPPLPGPDWALRWLRWDSGWYVRVAHDGYAAADCATPAGACTQATVAFLPAYPQAVKAVMQLGLTFATASFFFNALCLIVALWGLRRFTTLKLGGEWAPSAAFALLAFPTTVFFSAGYSEALFAAASIWGMVFLTEDRALPAALALSIASITRPHGVVLVACVVLVALLRRRWRMAVLIGGALALVYGAYMFWQQQRFGDPLAFIHARRAWGFPGDGDPRELLRTYWHRAFGGDIPLTGGQDFGALVLMFVTSIWAWRRLGPDLGLFCFLLAALPLLQGQVWGLSRVALGAFPMFMMFGSIRPRWRTPFAFAGLTLAALNGFFFVNGMVVA